MACQALDIRCCELCRGLDCAWAADCGLIRPKFGKRYSDPGFAFLFCGLRSPEAHTLVHCCFNCPEPIAYANRPPLVRKTALPPQRCAGDTSAVSAFSGCASHTYSSTYTFTPKTQHVGQGSSLCEPLLDALGVGYACSVQRLVWSFARRHNNNSCSFTRLQLTPGKPCPSDLSPLNTLCSSLHTPTRAHNHNRPTNRSHQPQQVSTLVVVEHRNSKVAAPTLNTLSAAGQLGGDVTALVGGSGVQDVAQQTASLPGVTKVRHCRCCGVESNRLEST